MEEARKRRLTITGFILVISMFFAGFVYSVFFTSKEDSYWAHFQQRAKASKTSDSSKRRVDIYAPFFLFKDEIVPMGKIKLIYRGRAEEILSIGVIIIDLDPESEYLHHIPLHQAEAGIRLGGEPFQVLSSSASKLKIQRTKQP